MVEEDSKNDSERYSKVGELFVGYMEYLKDPGGNSESKSCEYDIGKMVLDGDEILDGLNYLIENIPISDPEEGEKLKKINDLIKGKTGRFPDGLRKIIEG